MSCLYPEIGGRGLPNSGQTVGQERQSSITKDKQEFCFPLLTWAKISRKFCVRSGTKSESRQLARALTIRVLRAVRNSRVASGSFSLSLATPKWEREVRVISMPGLKRTTATRNRMEKMKAPSSSGSLCSETDKRDAMVTFPGSAKGHSRPLATWMKQA